MFKNLRTSTKLFMLCSMFIIAIGATTYGLVAEKLIAIDFTRRELAGLHYFVTLRTVYAAILTGRAVDMSGVKEGLSPDARPQEVMLATQDTPEALKAAWQEESERRQKAAESTPAERPKGILASIRKVFGSE